MPAVSKRKKAARKAAETRRRNQGGAAPAAPQYGGAAGTYGPGFPLARYRAEPHRVGNKIYWGRRANGKQNKRMPKRVNGHERSAENTRSIRQCAHTQWVPGYYRCKGNSASL